MKRKTNLEKIQRYYNEGRGDWWFYPFWKKILYVIAVPFVYLWLFVCFLIMKLGRGIYQFGDLISGWRWNGGDWMEEV